MITQKELLELFDYREDGELIWKVSRQRIKIGKVAGNTNNKGYKFIMVNYKNYLIHRLIFLYHHGYLPEFVDHIDGDKLNNRIENLRECTRSQNMYNQKKTKTNTSGVKGVSWYKNRGKWKSQCRVNGKVHYLGMYDDLSDAEKAVKEFREKQHGEFMNHG